MAGDLFVENLTYNQRSGLLEAGATDSLTIFHGDKPWSDGALNGRLGNKDRRGLPAHGYLTFKGGDTLQGAYRTDPITRLKLDDYLRKFSIPAFVSQKQALRGWPGVGPLSAVQLLEAAMASGSIILEYYKFDGSPIAQVFSDWVKVPE